MAGVEAREHTLIYTGLNFRGKGLTPLLLFPLAEPLAALAACGTNAANYGRGAREVVNWCAETRKACPFTLIGAGFDFMGLNFAMPVNTPEQLAKRLTEFFTDIKVNANDSNAVAVIAKEVGGAGRAVFFLVGLAAPVTDD
jgi:hypothetical protein